MSTELKNATTAPKTLREHPEIKPGDNGGLQIMSADNEILRKLYGVETKDVGHGLITSALDALGQIGKPYWEFMAALPVELEPRDAIEGMLVIQMGATHVATTIFNRRMLHAGTYDLRESLERSVTRLSRTYLSQMEALRKHRSKASQTVRVERVTVNEGGQAIVGDVTHQGRRLMAKTTGNPIDPTQRLRDAPRCSATAKSTRYRCRNPSKQGWNVCRLHGAGGGAPSGVKHPNYRHGLRTKQMEDVKRLVTHLSEVHCIWNAK